MGLDVTAHRNIKFLTIDEPTEEQWEEGVFQAFVIDPSWKNRISELKDQGFYTSEETEHFVSYGYGNHTYLRNQVCKMIGRDSEDWQKDKLEQGSDFEEWLNFADNEGVLDCKTSKKLLNDFKKWESTAEEKLDEWFLSGYKNWIKTFEFASENGAVEYH